MHTEDLITRLTAAAAPVRRVAHPATRVAQWAAVGVAFVALVALAMGPRPDLAEMLRSPAFVLTELAGIAVALCAAMAALSMGIPGFAPWWRLVAALLSLTWLVWFIIRAALAGLAAPSAVVGWDCLPSLLVFASVPMLVLAWQLQRSAPLAPARTLMYTAVAAGALGEVGAQLCHSSRSEAHLVYHAIGVLLLIGAAIVVAPRVLRWTPR